MGAIDWTSVNVFDIAIIIIIAFSIAISFFRGFLREAISLVTWVLAAVFALKFYHPLADALSDYINSPTMRVLVAGIGIFLVVLILGMIFSAIVRMMVDKSGSLNFLDRVVGVVFGAARGILVVALIILFLQVSEYDKHDWLQKSELVPQFNSLVTWLRSFLPEQVRQVSDWMKQQVKPDTHLTAQDTN